MRNERIVPNFAYERNARQTTHVEALSSDAQESIVQAVRVVIDLVRADAAGEKSVRGAASLSQQREIDPLIQLNSELSLWEVFLYLFHCVSLDARMIRHCHLRDLIWFEDCSKTLLGWGLMAME